MNTLDTTLYNLRPRPSNNSLAIPSAWSSTTTPSGTSTPGGSQAWGPNMWKLIDKEMSLRDCSIYCYSPEEDPYDGEEGAIWSLNYFFFNKARKRVCYLYLRGLSVMSHSPAQGTLVSGKRGARKSPDLGASKRARYWLGERAEGNVKGGWGEDDDDNEMIELWDDDEVDAEVVIDDGDDLDYNFPDDDEVEDELPRERRKSAVRGMSEDIAESMEV